MVTNAKKVSRQNDCDSTCFRSSSGPSETLSRDSPCTDTPSPLVAIIPVICDRSRFRSGAYTPARQSPGPRRRCFPYPSNRPRIQSQRIHHLSANSRFLGRASPRKSGKCARNRLQGKRQKRHADRNTPGRHVRYRRRPCEVVSPRRRPAAFTRAGSSPQSPPSNDPFRPNCNRSHFALRRFINYKSGPRRCPTAIYSSPARSALRVIVKIVSSVRSPPANCLCCRSPVLICAYVAGVKQLAFPSRPNV